MTQENTVQQLERAIQRHKDDVELGKGLERLRSNRDFKKIIVEGYLEQECIRLVLLKADINMQSEVRQASIVKQMDGIGVLHQYFQELYQKAAIAEKSLEADEQERDLQIAEAL